MATFLELVNLTRSEAGVAGGDLATLQTGLSQESLRFRTWVAQAWRLIQTEHAQWNFLRNEFQFNTTADQAFYTPQQAGATVDGTSATAPILAQWLPNTFRLSTAGNGFADEQLLGFCTWEQWRDLYQYGNMRNERSKPVLCAIRPRDEALAFGIIPDGAYTVVGEYYRTPQPLSADADEPIMPARFHDLVAYRALRSYGIFMSAPEVIGRADEMIGTLYADLVSDQLPMMTTGDPLA